MIEVFCDGGARGNPGPSAYGFIVKVNGQIVKKEGGYLGIATNNFAEYTAIIKALTWLAENYQGQDLKFYLDSQLAASQLSGLYKVKHAKIRQLFFEIKTLEPNFGKIIYQHIGRDQNKEADAQVNQALDEQLKRGT